MIRTSSLSRRLWRPALVLLVPLSVASPRPLAPKLAFTAGAAPEAARLYAEAAGALRRRDCASAQRTLAPLALPASAAAARGAETAFARLVGGLYAHACRQMGQAEERLFAAADPDGPLEDWRLFLLADAAAAAGHRRVAHSSLAKLLGDYPASPLRGRALLQAATLAWGEGDARRALELVARARREEILGPEATRLETLAWEIAGQTGDAAARAEAARRLLVHSPSEAARLEAAELFRRPDGSLVWRDLLDPRQIQQRVRSLLALGLVPNAQQTMAAVPEHERDFDWHLLQAEVLTRGHQGLVAFRLLASLSASDAGRRARLEWARGLAAADAATAQRGRADNLTAAERKDFQRISHQHLRKVVELGADRDLAVGALRNLYADLADAERFDEAMAALRKLRELDPRDTTGATNLWQRGWREYGLRNYSGAIGYWTELGALYPADNNARRGRYWTGRAFEALGESERAQQIYHEVAASDTTDLYRKSALARLRKPAPARAARPLPEPWPADPALERAHLLSDLGLDELARTEMAASSARANPQALTALEALVLARTGERRKSMTVIRDAFPALGGAYQAALPDQALRLYYPLDYQEPVRTWASHNRLPASLVFGIIRQESGFDPQATSWAGARGLMQLMPATARELAGKMGLSYSHDRLSDPAFNLRLGTTYFRQVLSQFDENLELALAGYNGGPYRIKRLWREAGQSELDRFLESLSLEESKIYVKRILVLSDSYRQLYPQAG